MERIFQLKETSYRTNDNVVVQCDGQAWCGRINYIFGPLLTVVRVPQFGPNDSYKLLPIS
jgi:hypothetical protein